MFRGDAEFYRWAKDLRGAGAVRPAQELQRAGGAGGRAAQGGLEAGRALRLYQSAADTAEGDLLGRHRVVGVDQTAGARNLCMAEAGAGRGGEA